MDELLKIESVNISVEKGNRKNPVDLIELTDLGIHGDAHRGSWHRQVSMLDVVSIREFAEKNNLEINFGDFAENITTSGLKLQDVQVFDIFRNDKVELEVTQKGKQCHGKGCVIYNEVGDCIMPNEGLFLRVKRGGSLRPGDLLQYEEKIFKVMIITVSDRASQGLYFDRSGPRLEQISREFFDKSGRKCSIIREVIPDDPGKIENLVKNAVIEKYDLIFTTGGTGIGPRDGTPEVVKLLLDKEIPGIMEHIRIKYGNEKPNALLSRGVAGVKDTTLIFTLPGSEKAVIEYTGEIFKTVNHSMLMLHGLGDH
jgi:molybdenum cofactor synthesis domain-containing protein